MFKKLNIVILFLLASVAVIIADNYEVKRLSPNAYIYIGKQGKVLRVGSVFSSTDHILWKNTNDAMEVMNLQNKKLYRFSKRQFSSKSGSIHSIADFYLRTHQASTRNSSSGYVATSQLRYSTNRNIQEKRIALVIGNSCYQELPPLLNPQRDAESITDKLLSLGFNVMEAYDCTLNEMKAQIDEFTNKAMDSYNVILFYYAGHGLQSGGVNYLVPVDAQLGSASNIKSECYSCNTLVNSINASNCQHKIVFLDACRNLNAQSAGAGKGLVSLEMEDGVIVFSTAAGNVAYDGDETTTKNSPFATALLQCLGLSRVSFSDMMIQVGKKTAALTANRQKPTVFGYLPTKFYFNPTSTSVGGNQTSSTEETDEMKQLIRKGKNALNSFRYNDAIQNFTNAADMGSSEALYQLGLVYENENSPHPSKEKAIEYYTKAANMGHLNSMYRLYEAYKGVDNAQSREWLKKYKKAKN